MKYKLLILGSFPPLLTEGEVGSFSMNRSMSIRSVSLDGSELDVSGLEAERRYLNNNNIHLPP